MRTAAGLFVVGVLMMSAILAVRLWGRGAAAPGSEAPSQPPAAGGEATHASPSSSPTQRGGGEGAVEIEVTLLRPGSPEAVRYTAGPATVFVVAMNTHSVDLSGYDLVTLSELRAGERRLRPIRWVATSNNTHHRSGGLIFPEVDRAAVLEVRLSAIAGVPVRLFRWAP